MTLQVDRNKDNYYIELLCVEDGSVDLEKLRAAGIPDEQIIVYRKGSKAPYLLRVKKGE